MTLLLRSAFEDPGAALSKLGGAAAIIATAAEALLGITLILGIFRRPVAFASAALFALFAGAMIVSFGVKAPLNFSVFAEVLARKMIRS